MTTAFRPFPPFMVFDDSQGAPLAGGSVKFYDTNTTTPRVVYGDKALTINNGSTLTLDSAGRLVVGDCWASGSYRVRLYSADNVLIDEYEDVEIPGGAGTTLPALAIDELITSDGSALVATTRREVPDPTGQANKVLSNDGTTVKWVPRPADGATPVVEPLPTGGVVETTTSLRAGKFMIQTGSGSAPASGGRTTSVAITFAAPMATGLAVLIMPNVAAITGVGYAPVWAVTNLTGTGCTVNFDVNADQSGADINVAVGFKYVAVGIMV